MKKKYLFLPLLALCLTGCGVKLSTSKTQSVDNGVVIYSNSTSVSSSNNFDSSKTTDSSVSTPEKISGDFSNESSTLIPTSQVDYGDFKIETNDGEYTIDGNVFTLTKAGTYDISGTISEGIIKVLAGEDDALKLNLNNVSIASNTNSPILVFSADSVEIVNCSGCSNTIIDKRDHKEEDNDELGNGAIYAKCDLDITGQGTLNVNANYNNGIHSTKDLKIKNSTVNVTSYNNSLKGNDSVTIKSGTLKLISTGGNGILTEDSDVSSKGNQRGTITIEGGDITIYSCKDAIDASYDVVITDEKSPKLTIYTSNYSQYSDEVVSSSGTTKYLKTTTALSSSQRYSVYYLNNDQYAWADCTYFTSQAESGGFGGPGGRKTYYFYSFELPSSTTAMQIYCFNSGSENSLDNYVAKSSMASVNTNYDTLVISKSNSTISLNSWTTYTTQQTGPGGMGPGGMGPGSEGNNDKATYSAKGIKANNEINISGGEIYIKAYDDGIHANYGDALENGETGKGDVIISGGRIEIYASDDGIHADRYLTVDGGDIDITNSYEGLEANIITVNGGDILIYASDDGLNAANKASLSIQIIVTGGRVDITVASGDTDGIDSNGTFTQSGGLVISRGSGRNMSTGLDTDGKANISGGTLVLFGTPETKPTTSGNVKIQTISGTFYSGTYTFTCGDYSFSTTNKMSYSGVYIYSDVGNTFSYIKN